MRILVTGSAVLGCLVGACGGDSRAPKPSATTAPKTVAKTVAKTDGDGGARGDLRRFSSTSLEPSPEARKSTRGGRSRGRIFGVAVAGDGRTYAVGDQAGRVDIRRGKKLLSTFTIGKWEIWSLQFSPDSKRLLVAADDTVGLWDIKTQKPLWRLDEAGIFKQAHMTRDGDRVALVATGHAPSQKTQVVRILSGASGAVIQKIRVNEPQLEQVRLIRKGTQLLVAGVKGIYRYRVDPPLLLKTIPMAHPSGFDYHAGTDLLAIADHNEVLRVVRGSDGGVVHRFNLRQGGYGKFSPVFSPDGRFLAAGGRSNSLWDVQTGMRLHHFGGPLTTGLRFLERGDRILITGNNGSIRTPRVPSFAKTAAASKVALPLSGVKLVRSEHFHEPGCHVASREARQFASPVLLFHVVKMGAMVPGRHVVVAQSPLLHRSKGGPTIVDAEVTQYYRRGNHLFVRVSVRLDHNRSVPGRDNVYLSADIPKSLTPGTYRVLVTYDEIGRGVANVPAAESVTTSFKVN